MKKTVLAIAAIVASALAADTITWTGNGDGKSWSDGSNWSSGTTPGASWDYDVVIDGDYTVEYSSGDLAFTGSLTIKGGATFKQTAVSWPNFPNGTLTIENGMFDLSEATGATALGTVVFNEGGVAKLPNGLAAAKAVVVNSGASVAVNAGIDTSKLTLNDGASFTATAGDFNVSSDTTFCAVTLTVYTITTNPAVSGDPRTKITLDGTTLTATRAGAVCGIWDARYAGVVNFKSGKDSSFTFPNAIDGATVTDKASAYTMLFKTGFFTFDGAELAEDSDTWVGHFDVSVSGGMATVAYTDKLSSNRIGAVAASEITTSSATLTATISSQDSGTLVKLAYGTAALTDAAILAGETIPVTDGVATAALSGLAEMETYYYVFAIVDANATEVLASKGDSFVASDYDYVWSNGAWTVGGTPAIYVGFEKMLFVGGEFTSAFEFNPANKKAMLGTVTFGAIVNGGANPMTLASASFVNTRTTELTGQCAYGFYNTFRPFDFITASGNGTIYRAASYTCYATEEQAETANVYEAIFRQGASNKIAITLNGEYVSESEFNAKFVVETEEAYTTTIEDGEIVDVRKTITDDDGEHELVNLTVALWDEFPEDAEGEWVVKSGARVRLPGRVILDSLAVEKGAKINLNGKMFVVSNITVDGEALPKGTYTTGNITEDSPLYGIIEGDGTLAVGKQGLSFHFR